MTITSPKLLKSVAVIVLGSDSAQKQDLFLHWILQTAENKEFHQYFYAAFPILIEAFMPFRDSKTLKLLDLLNFIATDMTEDQATHVLEDVVT